MKNKWLQSIKIINEQKIKCNRLNTNKIKNPSNSKVTGENNNEKELNPSARSINPAKKNGINLPQELLYDVLVVSTPLH